MLSKARRPASSASSFFSLWLVMTSHLIPVAMGSMLHSWPVIFVQIAVLNFAFDHVESENFIVPNLTGSVDSGQDQNILQSTKDKIGTEMDTWTFRFKARTFRVISGNVVP